MEPNNTNQAPAPQPAQKAYNMEPNVASALAYLLPPFTGILFFVLEKENRFVRFHAMQSILFGVAAFIAQTIAGALVAVLIGILLVPVVSVASFVLWLLLMWKAYNNEEYMLPFIGKMAKDQVNK